MRCPHCGYNSFAHLQQCKKCGGEIDLSCEASSNREVFPAAEAEKDRFSFSDEDSLTSVQPPLAQDAGTCGLKQHNDSLAPKEDFSPETFSWVAPNHGIPQLPGLEPEEEVDTSSEFGGNSGVPVPSPYEDEDEDRLGKPRLRRALFFGRRLLATGVDVAIVVLLWLCFYTLGHELLWEGQEPFFAPVFAEVQVRIGFYVQAVMIALAYFTLFHYFTGQTLGKMLTRIMVVPCEGEDLTLTQVLLRTSGGLISVLCVGGGYVAALFSAEGRGWNDLFAGSKVIAVGKTGDEDEDEAEMHVSAALLED